MKVVRWIVLRVLDVVQFVAALAMLLVVGYWLAFGLMSIGWRPQ